MTLYITMRVGMAFETLHMLHQSNFETNALNGPKRHKAIQDYLYCHTQIYVQ